MSITDELRTGGIYRFPSNRRVFTEEELTAIADRIDAEHESACAEAWDNGYEADFNGIERWLAEHPQVMERHGWMRMPTDADKVPIRIGDVMDSKVDYLFDGRPFVVRALVLCEDGWEVADGRFGNRYKPNSLHHHHEPTVEDVLREFGRGWHERMVGPETFDIADYVERYAAKLRLAGDAE